MYSLTVDSRDRLYLGTGAQLLRSTDLGATWQPINEGMDGITVYSLTVRADGTLLAATSSGMYISTDDAATWTPAT